MNISAYAIPGRTITKKTVEQAAAEVWDITTDELKERTRKRFIVEPRQAIMHYRHENMGHGPSHIARDYGYDHCTVLHSVKVCKGLLETNRIFRDKYNQMVSKL